MRGSCAIPESARIKTGDREGTIVDAIVLERIDSSDLNCEICILCTSWKRVS